MNKIKLSLCLYVLSVLILVIPIIIILIANTIITFFLGVLLGMYISCLIVIWFKDDKIKDKEIIIKNIQEILNELILIDDDKMTFKLIKMYAIKIFKIIK